MVFIISSNSQHTIASNVHVFGGITDLFARIEAETTDFNSLVNIFQPSFWIQAFCFVTFQKFFYIYLKKKNNVNIKLRINSDIKIREKMENDPKLTLWHMQCIISQESSRHPFKRQIQFFLSVVVGFLNISGIPSQATNATATNKNTDTASFTMISSMKRLTSFQSLVKIGTESTQTLNNH